MFIVFFFFQALSNLLLSLSNNYLSICLSSGQRKSLKTIQLVSIMVAYHEL